MQVFKIEKPILALALLSTADGNNFDELSSEVKDAGGKARLISDNLAQVDINGRTYDLPIGYVLVFDGNARLIGKSQFDADYVSAGDGSFDLDDLVARVNKVEAELGKLTKKAEPKSKTDKVSESAAGA